MSLLDHPEAQAILTDAVVTPDAVRLGAKQDGRIRPEERLIVIRPVGESRIDHALTNAGPEVSLAEVVRAQRQ
ncbi:hypothetical protein V5E97_12415 [Singulisphaera sp. Ch08]|uniref:Uncharacterized protein n=1 Tax=Singulisphaera sp. Ch08 TaxID=3120278 RepID=A0AAU7CNT7_9BACT